VLTREADVLLADGTAVHLRPIEPSDADGIVALHARFSARTRYLRYFSPYPRIPERDLHRFVNVDHHDREALVVSAGGRLLAVGRYERLGPHAPDAEVALVVEDAHQGRGIGSVLLEHLASAAREEGITRFVAEVLPENGTMLRVFADAGYQTDRRYADGVVHLTFPIAPTERSLAVQWDREHRTEARSIARLLAPRSIAVYGASASGHGMGAALLGHLRDAGFTGDIYPIHPSAGTVAGLPASPSLLAAGATVDLAVVAVPPEQVAAAVADAAAAGVAGLVVVTDVDSAQALRAARAAGMRLVGPNCFGIANTDPAVRLNATLAPALPPRGRLGFFSQSGALGIALLAEAERRGLGLSSFVSAGNRADVSGNDLLQYWEDDPATDAVLLYLESFGNPRKFARLARRIGRRKPVVAVASLVRPGSLLDSNAAAALFAHSGVIRVDTVAQLFDVGVLLARQPLPAGRRVAVVTNSPAVGWLAAAACRQAGLSVVDVADPFTGGDVDAVVVAAAPRLPGERPDPESEFSAQIGLAGDRTVVDTSRYRSVEEAVAALARVVEYTQWRRTPVGQPVVLPNVDQSAADPLSAYGIEVVPSAEADSADAAVTAADRFGYPVAVKAANGGLRHRLDLGAVRLDRTDPGAVRRAYAELAGVFGPSVLVQPMVAPGVACVVELVDDPAFGPVIGFGLGGVLGDLLGDRAENAGWGRFRHAASAWRPVPLTDRDAAALVAEPKAAPLLRGYRGAEPVDVAALEDLLLRVGQLADDRPEVRRVELNPVLARPGGLSVLHAVVQVGQAIPRPDTGPRSF
jgi:acyl-CoA synthetase (NDP forming)/GNAT superfamily N-acetyltransferase